MNNAFEVHTENLNKNLESVQRYMERFKDSITGDFEKIFDTTIESINDVFPLKDIISQTLDKVRSNEQFSEDMLNNEEIEITIEMNNKFLLTELEDALSKTTDLIRFTSEKNYAEVRIHIYSLFTYIIAIFEDYLKKILGSDGRFNDLLKSAKELFESNNINSNEWYRKIKGFQLIRNRIVHQNGEVNSSQYLLVTVNKDIKPLISTIDEFIEKYRTLLGTMGAS
ncbi:hypothetical protein J41TS12_06620 [Paenibacillus antibioticophila]|uniref:RiboL-PSP-HEPN domain-containing protein n=1 Tax=Paenibacillus antibioticophila TaxID=1274374 RepID=A0A920CDF7_9BACL|nr:hypothetical protein [Paenibacillus antibioticophila]GIO35801.1 hypothetical protein J41TS12_06620 [Paenibacillus antibioticophila]